MDFNTLLFLGFFAAVAVLNYLFPRFLRPYLLLVASYAFYMYKPENASLVFLLVTATLITWLCGLVAGRAPSKALRTVALAAAILACMSILVMYKYFGFLDELLVGLSGLFGGALAKVSLNLVAPLGLSYFTFQSLSYVIDVYKGRTQPCLNPLKYALFVSFFPCIFTGPIERYGHLMPQFENPRPFDYDRCAGGVFRMLWGYVKKMVLADGIAVFVSAVYKAPNTMNGPAIVLASLLFSFQIYLDFSGCCDVAIGGARLLGIDLLENFNRPFSATTFGDLWARWHMSLTGWFRDYIYFPMGGSRCGKARHYFNLVLVFLVSGLWHGAAWGYLLWGFSCGVCSVLAQLSAPLRRRLAAHNPLYRHAPVKRFLQQCVTYVLFTACVVFFVSALYGADPAVIFGGMTRGWEGFFANFGGLGTVISELGITQSKLAGLICCSAIIVAGEAAGNVSEWIRKAVWPLRWTLYYGLSCALLFWGAFGQSVFIYQNY